MQKAALHIPTLFFAAKHQFMFVLEYMILYLYTLASWVISLFVFGKMLM